MVRNKVIMTMNTPLSGEMCFPTVLERWSKESRENKQSMCVSFVFELDKIRKKSAECFILTHEGFFGSTNIILRLEKWLCRNKKTTPEGVVFELL